MKQLSCLCLFKCPRSASNWGLSDTAPMVPGYAWLRVSRLRWTGPGEESLLREGRPVRPKWPLRRRRPLAFEGPRPYRCPTKKSLYVSWQVDTGSGTRWQGWRKGVRRRRVSVSTPKVTQGPSHTLRVGALDTLPEVPLCPRKAHTDSVPGIPPGLRSLPTGVFSPLRL